MAFLGGKSLADRSKEKGGACLDLIECSAYHKNHLDQTWKEKPRNAQKNCSCHHRGKGKSPACPSERRKYLKL